MLRPSLHLALDLTIVMALITVLPVAGLVLPAPAQARSAAPKGEASTDPDALYEEGRKDFSQGFFKAAIEKFEAAYKRSKDPLILYNIGQSYKKLHDEDPQLDYLKKARTALQSYVAAVEKDPSLGADPEEVKPLLADIDAELARREPKVEPEGPAEPPVTPVPRGEDPGKKLRLGGIGMMAGGGAMVVIGSIVGGVFAAKGGRLSKELNGDGGLYDQQEAMTGCGAMAMVGENNDCTVLRNQIDSTRQAGEKSNVASAVSFGVVGGLGALLLIGGAVAFSLGRKRSADWQAETARVRVAPTFGGLVLQGRF